MNIEIRGAERLSFRERQVVVLKEMGMSNEQIAKRLSLAPGTVATLYNRAKAKGYQVVIVISGDPLGLFDSSDKEDEESSGIRGIDLHLRPLESAGAVRRPASLALIRMNLADDIKAVHMPRPIPTSSQYLVDAASSRLCYGPSTRC